MMKPDKSFDPSEEPRGEPPARTTKNSGADQPIAIVGMACRFPGAPDLPAFWRLLEAGENAVSEGVPGSGVGRVGELFPEATVQSKACRFGAYLDGLDQFDASFFRISPVEAQLLDPQQRLMLETSWQALEDAGMDPDRLKGSRTGVYAGIINNDYWGLILDVNETAEPAASLYTVTGTSFNTAIGRVAFALDLEGPAMAVDTACSSSLVAIHQAVSGLQRGESDLALAGGVHTILSRRLMELRANAGMLSPDGRCATFDAAANGYVRGEGCGIVVLKRLAEAEADGDRIWGVIRGSALNQDGASSGLTVPNGAAQERVIEAALLQARVPPSQVDYLEAHGTGTTVGDPIEINAAAAVYGRGRDAERPLLIGSVKTNIGHLESAAGVAGVIKVVLAMKQRVIPKHLHFRNPNPQMDWDRLPLQVTSVPTDWSPHSDRPPLAGVSGFGWSGTNAHVVLEGYELSSGGATSPDRGHWAAGPALPIAVSLPESVADQLPGKESLAPRGTRFLPLSGKSEGALRELAERYLSWLDERAGEPSSEGATMESLLSDMAWTAGVGRSHFDHRAGVVFHDAGSLRERLKALAKAGEGAEQRTATKVAFAYTGQGSQWVGMGQALYESEPVARAVLDLCEAVFRDERGASLLDVMFGRAGGEGKLDDTAWEQPALYALECALTALWASVGIRPSVVVGHSVGELAAAQAVGVFSLEDGMRFAAARGTLLSETEPGAMAGVFAPAARVAAVVRELNAASAGVGLSISADNGTHQVVSGPVAEIETISKRFESERVRVTRLNTARAFHSVLVDPVLDALEASLDGVVIEPPSLTVVSNLTGRAVELGQTLDGEYWKRHAREPVAFARGVRTLAELGADLVVEIGPHSVLAPMAVLAWPESPQTPAPVVLWSLRQPSGNALASGGEGNFVEAVAEAYQAGLPIRFAGLFAGEARRRISLPSYPFQREHHWIKAPKQRRRSAGHPLLGVRHESARGEITFETEVLPSDPVWLRDHRVFGRIVAPGALYGAMAASAALAEGSRSVVVEDMQLHNPLVFPDEGTEDGTGEGPERKVQVLLDASGEEPSRSVQIFSKGGTDEGWTLHAEGRVPSASGSGTPEAAARVDLKGLKAGLSPVDVSALYRAKADVGIDLGPSFRMLQTVWSRPGEAWGEVSFPGDLGRSGIDVHPLLLDGCFQVMGAARNPTGAGDGTTYLPFGWERLWLTNRLPDRVICHVRMRGDPRGQEPDMESAEPPEVLTADVGIYDPNGDPIGALNGYTVKRATRAALLSAIEGVKELLYEVVWRDHAFAPGMLSADFLPSPSAMVTRSPPFSQYLTAEGVGVGEDADLQTDLERLSWSYALSALETLGWERRAGAAVDPETLRQRLEVLPDHARLFRRMLEIVARSGVLEATGDGFVVAVGAEDPLPDESFADPEGFAARLGKRHPHGSNEIGLFRRCAGALAEVLRGREDPLSLLFGDQEPQAADLYRRAPVWRAANRMLGDVVQTLVAELPDGRRLRVLEVGAGIGSVTECILPGLPAGQFDYTYTDISAGFFADAEARFSEGGAQIDYRGLDIEQDPVAQGFDSHGYDLVIAANVLHATRHLDETLMHCRELLAPSGQLVALELLRSRDWQDLAFGLLDGWWRFADAYRPNHALTGPAVWRQALTDAGFGEVEVLSGGESEHEAPDRGVILARGPADVTGPSHAWILTADRGGAAAQLATELAARNQTVVLAAEEALAGGVSAEKSPGVARISVEPERQESWRSLLEGLPADVPLGGVVHLAALDGHGVQATSENLAEDVRRADSSALALVQGMMDAGVTPVHGVWFVTRGAQVLERERAGQLAGATLWGFGKVVAREAAHLQPRMIDLDPGEMASAPDLVNELLYPDHENHIAYREGRRQVARMVRAGAGRLALPEGSDWVLPLRTGRLRQDRTYLVTGGLGGIGCAVAGWLADRGAGAIVLNGRRAPDAAAEEAIGVLRERGVTVGVELADVTDAAAVDGMLARMDRELPPLGGVIHSAGVLSDSALGNQSWEKFETVLWPKMLGAWHLHRATADRDLDLFVLFSSVAGVLGNPGQANHAAANAFLDQLAAHRRALGLPGQAIAWGAWSGLGEAEEQRERIARRREASGTGWFSPEQGLRAFDRLVRQDAATSVVMSMDWSVFEKTVKDRPPLLEDLLSATAEDNASAFSDDLLSRLREAPAAARADLLVSFLQREVQAVLRLPAPPAPTVGFFDLGMDSLMAVEIRNRLNRAFSGEYVAPNTVVFDYPDIAGLAHHLVGELGEVGSAPDLQAQPKPEQRPTEQQEKDGIAIVGMACRFPGATDLSAFWRQLEAGGDGVTDGRQDSGSWNGVAGDPAAEDAASRRGAFVEGIDRFDASFFGIAPIAARMMDPRQRLLLETSWQALEDAGMDPGRLNGSRTGVYAGIAASEYRDLIAANGEDENYLGTASSVAVGRIAFALGLMGPAIPLDTACASSLVAVHQAVAGLQQGEVDLALVGGVNAILSPAITKFMTEVGMLSASGRCRTFDASADGFVRGEGCGMVVLKRLSEAEVDGDRIWGVIRGSAVNQNGVSAGPTVPNGPAQERVIEEALSRAGVSPSEVDYLEAHGAGSGLGDQIEVQAAAAVYGRGREAERPLLLGSVKTNIGHLDCASGIAGLIKVMLAMKQGVIPKHLHFRNPNPHLDWDRLPVRVTSESTEWPQDPDQPPRAGVSAFGISGTNAHVVVEGYGAPDGAGLDERHWPTGAARPVAVALPESVADLPLTKEGPRARRIRCLPLSGKSDGALRELAGRYLLWLDEHAEELSSKAAMEPLLADMAWTAGGGRSHFNHRAGVVFRDTASLREGLRALVAAGKDSESQATKKVAFAYTGQASQWVGMGEALYASEPVVRAVLDRCDAVLREARGASLLEVMFGRAGAAGNLNDATWTQPALYALECALTALWSSVGIRPGVVVGHDLGELAAAQAAGVFGLEDGLRLASARDALVGALPGAGAAQSDPDDLEAALADVVIAPPSLALVSNVTGLVVEPGDALDGAYWGRQAREPVAFDRCVKTFADLGVEVVVEIGPQAVLGPVVARSWPKTASADGSGAPVVLSSLARPSDGDSISERDRAFVEAVAGAYEEGLPVSFAGLFAGERRRRISLPGYPFQRRRYWVQIPKR